MIALEISLLALTIALFWIFNLYTNACERI
jgi:hypothetical protein